MTIRDLVPRSLRKKKVPVRYSNEYSPLNLFEDRMERLFDDFLKPFDIEPFGGYRGEFVPSIDVAENEKEITVTAELPGMDEKDIDVSVTREALTIKGEKREEKEKKDDEYFYCERRYGSFYRTLPLSDNIDLDRIDAHFKKGVLKIRLPKTEEGGKLRRKITIN